MMKARLLQARLVQNWNYTNLNMHLYDGFPNQSGTKKGPEGNQEMTASYSGQVKQRIGDLNAQNTHEQIVLSTFNT